MSVMTRLMDVPSDDLFAEMFTKQLGVLFGRGGTIAAGARVISGTIAGTYGLHPTILDGSGLSRDDASSPLEIVDLLRGVWQTPDRWSARRVAAHGRRERDGAGDRSEDRGPGQMHRQDGNAGLRDQPGRVLPQPRRPRAGLRADDRRPGNYTAILLEDRMIGAIAHY